ncbi:hypothetical protein HYFRA_00004511 [Hymenoscyphus fraxineus]|uniref:Uncharacterized protein n=1 Tax=Hymenoscyphus fraxineus TaxID=746836 RepID=A0A9N9KW78_9HELO|nr:hypothetical protein HYFRA_00004511 [Hymenoscyphus fraxineus]
MAFTENTPPATPSSNARLRRLESLKKTFKVPSSMGSITSPRIRGESGQPEPATPKNVASPLSSGGTPQFYTPINAPAGHASTDNVVTKNSAINKGKAVDTTLVNQTSHTYQSDHLAPGNQVANAHLNQGTNALDATPNNNVTSAATLGQANNTTSDNEASSEEAPTTKLQARLKGQFIAQMDMLELLPQRIHIRKVGKELCEQKAQIYELEEESASALEGLPYMEMQYHSSKLKYNQLLEIYGEKERIAEALLKDTANMSPMEKLTARRAELAVVEMKPEILRRAIDLEELELVLAEKKSKSMNAEDKIAALKEKVDNNQEMLAVTEKEADAHVFKFSDTLPASSLTPAGIKASLETAVKVLTERLDQVELLLESVTEIEKKGDDEGDDEDAIQHNRLRKTRSALIKELEEAYERNEQLMPLFLVGLHVRSKRIEELIAKKGNRKPDVHTLVKGSAAVLDADVKADATLDILFKNKLKQDGKSTYFKDFYHLDPELVWKHRNFTMFVDMINMGVDMDTWRNRTPAFVDNYNKLIKEILPDFKIGSDEELQAVFELDRAFGTMDATYHKIAYELRKPAILAENYKLPAAGPSAAPAGDKARSG